MPRLLTEDERFALIRNFAAEGTVGLIARARFSIDGWLQRADGNEPEPMRMFCSDLAAKESELLGALLSAIAERDEAIEERDAALASRTAETAEEWEYGWVARFENGELYDWGERHSREAAARSVERLARAEAEGELAQIPEGRLLYSLERRHPASVAGPWEPVPPTPETEESDRG